jgi:hypothetical protein
MDIYLDINETLLKKDGTPAFGIVEFLKYITDNHSVYWLTTHCRNGDNSYVLKYLEDKLPIESHDFLKKIKATKWDTLKTSGIDFSQDFRWLDDYVMESEKKVLKENNCEEKQILIDLKNNPKQLLSVIELI